MSDDVNAWLKGNRDYAAGMALLRDNGASAFMLDLLKDGPGPFNTAKLLKEVEKLKSCQFEKLEQAVSTFQPSNLPTLQQKTYTPNRDLEKKIRTQQLIANLFKEIVHLHGKLSTLAEGKELFECAKLLMAKDMRRRELWDHLYYFEQNGKWFDELPENQVKDFDPADKEQLEQKIKNLMASRSKVSKLLKQPWPPAIRQHHENRLTEFNKQIDHYKSLR